ncbi:MAG: hypothetical protein JKY12_05270 [Sneathiella sp.]|nr:hypothetical protein [Sneathiella sp.]
MRVEMERQIKIKATVDAVRSIVAEGDLGHGLLTQIKDELLELAEEKHLFSFADFPPPGPNSDRRSCLYRLSEDDDNQFALYANVANGKVDAPPHDHTTWAVIVGVAGAEENRFYKKGNEGPTFVSNAIVKSGAGVTLLPDDLHSIHIKEGAPVLNFHMYGLGLEQLPGRNFWSEKHKEWRIFPAHTDIREART